MSSVTAQGPSGTLSSNTPVGGLQNSRIPGGRHSCTSVSHSSLGFFRSQSICNPITLTYPHPSNNHLPRGPDSIKVSYPKVSTLSWPHCIKSRPIPRRRNSGWTPILFTPNEYHQLSFNPPFPSSKQHTCMRPLEPVLSRTQELSRDVGGVLGALRAGGVPGARDGTRAIGEGVWVVENPFTTTYDLAGWFFDGVDVVRTGGLFVFSPLEVCVCGFIFGTVFCRMAVDGVEDDKCGSRGRMRLIGMFIVDIVKWEAQLVWMEVGSPENVVQACKFVFCGDFSNLEIRGCHGWGFYRGRKRRGEEAYLQLFL